MLRDHSRPALQVLTPELVQDAVCILGWNFLSVRVLSEPSTALFAVLPFRGKGERGRISLSCAAGCLSPVRTPSPKYCTQPRERLRPYRLMCYLIRNHF